MQRRTDEARGARWWTRLLGGSALAAALALPAAALAEPAPDDSGAAQVQAPAQPEPAATEASPTVACPSPEGPTNRRSNCENDFTQNCFQPAASGAPRGEPASFAQSQFQPASAPER
jgi:hypothetical protein